MRNPIPVACLALLLGASTLACSKSEKREWNASDHDRSEENQAPQRAPTPTAAAPAPTAPSDPWASNCAPCHGVNGRGDGPMGAALHAPDLTNKDWQAKTADATITQTITHGRGRMPAFGSLRQSDLDALVKHVRSFK